MNDTIHVLIIEDDPAIADYLKEVLSGTGHPALTCSAVDRLSEGLARLRQGTFEIVLLDLGLPDSDGMDTALTLKQQFPEIPIVVLTGLDDEELGVKALRMNVQDYLIKGQISAPLLVRSVRYAIERKRIHEALRVSEQRYRALVHMTSSAVWRTSADGETLLELTGAVAKEYTQPERKSGEWLEFIHPEDRKRTVETWTRAVETKSVYEIEHRTLHPDGTYHDYLSRGVPVLDPSGQVCEWVGSSIDITQRKKLEERIMHMAQHDELTGLPNRHLFHEISAVELAQAQRNGGKIAVFFLDLDRFKEINDTLGHDAGDELLKQTAYRLRSVVRVSDTVARIGGDEFNVIIPDMIHPEYASEVGRKILNEIRKPYAIKGQEITVSTSIGISIFPNDGREIDTLLRYADIAMYHAKEKGRNNYQFYNPVINTRSIERMKFENSLRRAIERNEFRLYFQPLVDVATGKIVSAEVLLRWQHPERGLLEPGQFFGAAEDIGFMQEIDDWVLKRAGTQIKAWLDEGINTVCVTVNLSNRQFQSPDLLARVSAILRETGMPPECLDIEITESAAMGNIEETIRRLAELTKMGLHVSIDDFGTGYSSLHHLKRMPIRKIKIDRSFIRDIANDSGDRAVINAVLLLAHSLRLKVVAEGVEGDNQLMFLREAQCDEAQGYLFSKPLPAERFRELVAAGR